MEQAYLQALRQVYNLGNPRTTRNGVTRANFAIQMRHDMREGYPLLTTKLVPAKLVNVELLWFLEAGKHSPVPYRMSNARFREMLGVAPEARTIWSHDQEKPEWLAKAQFPGDCGRIYGAQWRNWNGHYDQIANLVRLLRTDMASRYMKVTAWNPGEMTDMCLAACHGDFTCFVKDEGGEKLLSLHMNQRSCDMFLGVPFNIASYASLLHMLAQISGMVAHELVITLNDAHIYDAHRDAVATQLARTPGKLPTLRLNPERTEIDEFVASDFEVIGYAPQAKIPAPLL